METYKQQFIEFMVRSKVLTFGDFTTKSGRRTPFFINTGNYRTGSQIRALGEFYAAAMIKHLGDRFDVLYGPAYKGIPLVVAAASALAGSYGRDVAYCFNRKEAKDHGEGGIFIGQHANRRGPPPHRRRCGHRRDLGARNGRRCSEKPPGSRSPG